jgi:hypothetical protein
MLDRVGVVWARLLKEHLEVVSGQPHLTLAAAQNSRDVRHAGAVRSLVVPAIVNGRGCGLLKSLLPPCVPSPTSWVVTLVDATL